MPESKHSTARSRVVHDTRFDQFLYREGVNLDELADALKMTRQNLAKLREGRKPRQDTIARIVLAVRRVLGRPIMASELFYLGEAHDDHTKEAQGLREYAA